MDFTAILGAIPTLGPIGLVLIILAYVGRQWISSDGRYKAELDRLTTAHKAELERINKSHDDEILELRNDIAALRGEIVELRKELNAERLERYLAQEEAHRLKLKSGTDKE